MRLLSIATALPERSYTQEDCWRLAEKSAIPSRLKLLSFRFIRRLLHTDMGVERRHFALDGIDTIFDRDADALAEGFRREAPKLASAALVPALERAGVSLQELDALFICTCTGYLCPGVTSYVAEMHGLRDDCVLHDVVGLGCGAALPTWRAAAHFLAANPGAKIATVAVEICSAAFYLDDDPGVMVSALLFGDGAAACVWEGRPPEGHWTPSEFHSLHQPQHRDRIRFETRNGRLRNLLDSQVPKLAGAAVKTLAQRSGLREEETVLTHTGGRDVLDALEAALPGRTFEESRRVLRDCGNMSSPSVLFSLEHRLATGARDPLWLTAFGAGFSAHCCRLVHV